MESIFRESSVIQEAIRQGRFEGAIEGRQEGLLKGREEGREEGRLLGRAEASREILLRLGTRLLGEPSAAVRAQIDRIADFERLEQMIEIAAGANSWDDVLTTS